MKIAHPKLAAQLAGIACIGTLISLLAPSSSKAQESPASDSNGQAKDQIVVLNPFTVESENSGYKVSNMTSATRLNTPIDDIPQNVAIISSDLMKDIGAFEVRDAFEYTPGVTQRQNAVDGQVIYGFTNSLRYENGFAPASSAGTAADYTSDTSFIDRLEIIKGPAAAIAGQSAAAGYMNIVTKQPVPQNFIDTSVSIASYNYKRFVLDMGGSILDSGNQKVMYRFVAAETDGDGFRQNAVIKITSFYPAVTWQIGSHTTLTAEAILMDSTTPSDIGSVYFPGHYAVPAGVTPAFDNSKATWAPQSLDINEAGEDLLERPIDIFATLVHNFNDHISIREGMNYRNLYVNYDRVNEGVAPAVNGVVPVNYAGSVIYIDPTTGNLMFARLHNDTVTYVNMFDNQGDLLLQSSFFGINNRDDLGYIYSKTRTTVLTGSAPMAPLSIFHPQYGVSPSPITSWVSDLTSDYGSAWSYFINHQSLLFNDRLIATVGLRQDEGFANDRTNNLNDTVTVIPSGGNVLSKMFALMVRPTPWLGFYATDSQAGSVQQSNFLYPSAAVNAPGQQTLLTSPVTIDREFGAKAELLDQKLSVTLTHFDVVAEDAILNVVSATAPGGKLNLVQTGDSAIGWELTANGHVTNNLQLVAGYDYIFTHYPLGTQQNGTPIHKLVALLNYGFKDYQRNQWHVRFGCLTESSPWGTTTGGTAADLWHFPGGTQLDTGFDYSRGSWTFDFSIRNLTNIVFVEYGGNQTSNTVNTPREIMATLSRRW